MSSYCTGGIHTLIHPSQISTYSSLAGALTPAPPPSQFTSPSRHRVPQRACKNVDAPAFSPISFDYFSQARQGVALRGCVVKSKHAINQLISCANEPVLATAGIQKIDLRIMVSSSWPRQNRPCINPLFSSGWVMNILMLLSPSPCHERQPKASLGLSSRSNFVNSTR